MQKMEVKEGEGFQQEVRKERASGSTLLRSKPGPQVTWGVFQHSDSWALPQIC